MRVRGKVAVAIVFIAVIALLIAGLITSAALGGRSESAMHVHASTDLEDQTAR
jgi:hypothetical protein